MIQEHAACLDPSATDLGNDVRFQSFVQNSAMLEAHDQAVTQYFGDGRLAANRAAMLELGCEALEQQNSARVFPLSSHALLCGYEPGRAQHLPVDDYGALTFRDFCPVACLCTEPNHWTVECPKACKSGEGAKAERKGCSGGICGGSFSFADEVVVKSTNPHFNYTLTYTCESQHRLFHAGAYSAELCEGQRMHTESLCCPTSVLCDGKFTVSGPVVFNPEAQTNHTCQEVRDLSATNATWVYQLGGMPRLKALCCPSS